MVYSSNPEPIHGHASLTPVQLDPGTGTLFKREDLFQPWGAYEPNGGKCRQFQRLLRRYYSDIIVNHGGKLVVQTSVFSTSGPILAAAAFHHTQSRYGFKREPLKVIVCVGGLKNDSQIDNHHMLRLAKFYGADVRNVCGTGMSSPIMARLREICEREKAFNATQEWHAHQTPHAILGPIAAQVQNLPDELDYLVVPVGGGIQLAGILQGLQTYDKHVGSIIGCHVGPDRTETIRGILAFQKHPTFRMQPVQLTHYSSPHHETIEGVGALDTCYEAKMWQWVKANLPLGIRTCVWLVGRKLTESEVANTISRGAPVATTKP